MHQGAVVLLPVNPPQLRCDSWANRNLLRHPPYFGEIVLHWGLWLLCCKSLLFPSFGPATDGEQYSRAWPDTSPLELRVRNSALWSPRSLRLSCGFPSPFFHCTFASCPAHIRA